jgi:hypothetical protein
MYFPALSAAPLVADVLAPPGYALDYWLNLTRLRILDALCGESVAITTDE